MSIARGLGLLVALALLLSLATASGRAGTNPPSEPSDERPSKVVVRVSDGGFHWVDAGLGAAAGLASTLIALGLVLALRPDHDGKRSAMSARLSRKESR